MAFKTNQENFFDITIKIYLSARNRTLFHGLNYSCYSKTKDQHVTLLCCRKWLVWGIIDARVSVLGTNSEEMGSSMAPTLTRP